MLTATVQAIQHEHSTQLAPVLLPIFQEAWPFITQVMQQGANDTAMVDSCCELVIKVAYALKAEFAACF